MSRKKKLIINLTLLLLITWVGHIIGQESIAQNKIKIFVSQDVIDELGIGQRLAYQIRESLTSSERYTVTKFTKEASAEIGVLSAGVGTIGSAISVTYTFHPRDINFLFGHYIVYLPRDANIKKEAENIIAMLDKDYQKYTQKFREINKIWVAGVFSLLKEKPEKKKN